MDSISGLSQITVQLPKSFHKGWRNTEFHNIIIDNKIGLATIAFQTEK